MECQAFFSNHPSVKEVPTGVYRIAVETNGTFVNCYRRSSNIEGSRGWCTVDTDASLLGELSMDKSWGFCSTDCFLKDNSGELEPAGDVLRHIDSVDILDDPTCGIFLNAALKNITVSYRPEILCIGRLGSSVTEKYAGLLQGYSFLGSGKGDLQ